MTPQEAEAAIRIRAAAHKARLNSKVETLDEFMIRAFPSVDGQPTVKPTHLQPLLDAYSRVAAGERVKILMTLPPGSGKTLTTLMGHLWLMVRHRKQVMFCSYNNDIATEKSADARDMVKLAGGELRQDRFKANHWHLTNGSSFRAVGIGGTATGGRGDLIDVDDPIKGPEDARSAAHKRRVWDWLWTVLSTRDRAGTSFIVKHTRWAEDDPIGRILAMEQALPTEKRTWEYIHLPALGENDESNIPWYPSEHFRAKRDEYYRAGLASRWHALYQGAPRPPEGTHFKGCRWYNKLPDGPLEWGAGADFAYSASNQSDWNVVAILARDPATQLVYVVHVERWRGGAETHRPKVAEVQSRWPQAFPALFLGSGIEKGAGALIPGIEWRQAATDKVARSMGLSAAWNVHYDDEGEEVGGGRILIPTPEAGPTFDVKAFTDELHSFPGGAHDDQVDAAAGAFIRLGELSPFTRVPRRLGRANNVFVGL